LTNSFLTGGVVLALAATTAPVCAAAGPFAWLSPSVPPAGWKQITLPTKVGVLSIPPLLRLVKGDPNAVSAAQTDSRGNFLAYVNATPKEGSESLANWSSFRLSHLREETAASVRTIAAAKNLPFRGGHGSCVIDVYVTRVKHHAYHEIACYVSGAKAGSVVIAAAPPTQWARVSKTLERVVASYRVR
jgi:hypothetical protein